MGACEGHGFEQGSEMHICAIGAGRERMIPKDLEGKEGIMFLFVAFMVWMLWVDVFVDSAIVVVHFDVVGVVA